MKTRTVAAAAAAAVNSAARREGEDAARRPVHMRAPRPESSYPSADRPAGVLIRRGNTAGGVQSETRCYAVLYSRLGVYVLLAIIKDCGK